MYDEPKEKYALKEHTHDLPGITFSFIMSLFLGLTVFALWHDYSEDSRDLHELRGKVAKLEYEAEHPGEHCNVVFDEDGSPVAIPDKTTPSILEIPGPRDWSHDDDLTLHILVPGKYKLDYTFGLTRIGDLP